MSWKDSITSNIYNDKFAVQPFWATFLLKIPNEKLYCEVLYKLKSIPELIEFAEPNFKVRSLSAADDLNYNMQESLNGSPIIPNAGINIEEAWGIETGEKFIKVAILDSGIDTSNMDMKVLYGGFYTNPSTFNNQFPMGYGNDFEGHGTAVASIIGAKRNNDFGIAGIAGGNNENEKGVSLIDLRYSFSSNSGSSYLCAATIDAARSVGSYWSYPTDVYYDDLNYFKKTPGFGVHIQNNSFVIRTDLVPRCDLEQNWPTDVQGGFVIEPVCNLCREAFLFSYKSGVINVVARGNSNQLNEFNSNPNYVEKLFPQNLPDNWILSVGASGYDGTTVRYGVNQGVNDAINGFYSLYGANMDIIAPGSDSIVYAIFPSSFNNGYRWFNGTSAAAPHVSGVVALLLSHYNKDCYSNKNLAIEDVEYILEKSATDVLDTGFDEISGAGRLNAGAALKMIENPTKQIVHPQTLLSSLEIERDTIALKYGQAFVAIDWGPISSGFPLTNNRNYQVVKVLYENTYSFAEYGSPEAVFDSIWVRPSASNSLKSYEDTIFTPAFPVGNYIFDYFDMTPDVKISNVNLQNKTIKTQGYYYHFINQFKNLPPFSFEIDENVNMNTWLPINPEIDTVRMPISIYILDSMQTSWYDYPCDSLNLPYDSTYVPYSSLNSTELEFVKVYPNPTKEYLQIDFENLIGLKQIELRDLNGKLIQNFETDNSNYYLNTINFSNGVYFLTCKQENNLFHLKIIKE